ncbi:glycosyltransferase family 4 protein [Bacillus infantis]|uniref:glycosyltransferase family 4 protein n=1 Tax=Bacillus infantis TaxID=324767 RepID=UPI003981D0A5
MKVLFLTTVPSPYRVDFFESLGKLCDLTVLYESKVASYREKDWMMTQASNYKSNYLEGKTVRGTFFPTNLKQQLFNSEYDIYVISGYSTLADMLAIYYLKREGKAFLLSCDGALQRSESTFKYNIKRKLISSASGWLSTGDVTDEFLMHYGVQKDKIYFYPFTSIHNNEILDNSVGVAEKRQLRSKLDLKEEKIILTVGQFIHRKGIDVLLEASKNLTKEYGFYIIGGNPTSEYLEFVRNHKLTNVHFISFKSKKELIKYYMAADLFVLPTREDIWGLVVNEAMACGLPVITTDRCVAGLELIKDGINGYIVPVEDSEAIAHSIKGYYSDSGNYSYMSNNCLNTIRSYTIEKMAARHFEIFKKLYD